MRFLSLDVQALNVNECHFILPLVTTTFITWHVAFISSPSVDVQSLFSLTIKDRTY